MIPISILVLILFICNSNALKLSGSRFVQKALTNALVCVGGFSLFSPQHFTNNAPAISIVAPAMASEAKPVSSIFSGSYDDPNHPGCLRKISAKGKDISIIGSDNLDGSKQWLIKAREDFPGTIFVDFSPKGGPTDLLGVYNEDLNGIKWPDGNLWTKLK